MVPSTPSTQFCASGLTSLRWGRLRLSRPPFCGWETGGLAVDKELSALVSPIPETLGVCCPKESNCFLDFTLLFPTLLLQGQLSSKQIDVAFNPCYKLMFSLIYQYIPSGTNQDTGYWQCCQSQSLFLTFFPSLGTSTGFFPSPWENSAEGINNNNQTRLIKYSVTFSAKVGGNKITWEKSTLRHQHQSLVRNSAASLCFGWRTGL